MTSWNRESASITRPRPLGQRTAIGTQRRKWDRAATTWDHHGLTGLGPIVEAVLAEATAGDVSTATSVDIGAGTGAIAVPLAAQMRRVVAVDVSRSMLGALEVAAAHQGIDNIDVRLVPIEDFDLPPASVDLVVSNYALHHLLDRDKKIFVEHAAVWLRPGGRLVIGDMMLGRGASAADRAIIRSKVRVMLARGPSGWWRVVKNAWRYLSRTSERPIPLEQWMAMLRAVGLVDVSGRRVVAEAAVVTARRPVIALQGLPGRHLAEQAPFPRRGC